MITPAEEHKLACEQACGDRDDAMVWLRQISQISMIWDHVVDGDPWKPDEVSAAFEVMLTEWPYNAFWRQHGVQLAPALAVMISSWRFANAGGPRLEAIAVYKDLPCLVAWLLGGRERMQKVEQMIKQSAINHMEQNDKEQQCQPHS